MLKPIRLLAAAALAACALFANAQEGAPKQQEFAPASGSGRVVVLISGQTGMPNYVATAQQLADAGFYTVLVDGNDFWIKDTHRALAMLKDVIARAQASAHALPGKVGVVGYCWGGSVAFLANTRLGLPAVSYYGARTTPFLDEAARAPMLFHFGADDASIPAEAIALHRERQPSAQVYVYAGAGHAFNRQTDPAHHDPGNAALARTRTLAFLAEHAA